MTITGDTSDDRPAATPRKPSCRSPKAFAGFLDVEHLDVGLSRGLCHEGAAGRAFGGQVAAQALLAAGSTVDAARHPVSLHALFLRPGDVERPVMYHVENLRDGGTFSSRRVTARQQDAALATVSVSFARPGPVSLSVEPPAPQTPGPAESTSMPFDVGASAPHFNRVIEQRLASQVTAEGHQPAEQRWLRALTPLPADPMVHAAALTYVSDIRLAATPILGHRTRGETFAVTSLDHSIRWIRPLAPDQWFLFSQVGQSLHRGMGLAEGDIFDESGQLAVHVSQQALMLRRPPAT